MQTRRPSSLLVLPLLTSAPAAVEDAAALAVVPERRKTTVVGLSLALLLALSSFLWPAAANAGDIASVAILDFRAWDAFSDVEAKLLSDKLQKGVVRGLKGASCRLIAGDELATLSGEMGLSFAECDRKDLECQREMASDLGIEALLSIEVAHFGEDLVVTITIYDTETGGVLASRQEEAAEQIVLFRSLAKWSTAVVKDFLKSVRDGSAPTQPGEAGTASRTKKASSAAQAKTNPRASDADWEDEEEEPEREAVPERAAVPKRAVVSVRAAVPERGSGPVWRKPQPAPVAGELCSYTDLHDEFIITADCAGLQDFSGIAQPHKRLWLSGTWGQLEIMEVPQPYRAAKLDLVMQTLARYWSKERTPKAVSGTTVAGMDARVVTERKQRTTSRTWVFNFRGRNITVRAVAYGKRKLREANLEQIASAFESGFKANSQ